MVQILVNKALIMAEIEVGLRAVLGDIDLAVLIGAHSTGVDIDVRIELLRRDLQPPRLEQSAKRCRCDTLSKSRNHAACYKDILGHFPSLRCEENVKKRSLGALVPQ